MAQLKLRSSTLFETMVAMVILMVVFGIALVTYLKITQSSLNGQKLKAMVALEEAAFISIKEKRFFDEVLERNRITIEKSVLPYEGNSALFLLHLIAKDSDDHILAERKEIILYSEE